jgi:hypothetical protein
MNEMCSAVSSLLLCRDFGVSVVVILLLLLLLVVVVVVVEAAAVVVWTEAHGSIVVEALGYKPKSHWFETR